MKRKKIFLYNDIPDGMLYDDNLFSTKNLLTNTGAILCAIIVVFSLIKPNSK